MTNAREQDVLNAIRMDELLDCLDELIAIPSLGGQETPAQEHVAALMRGMGMDVDIWSIDLDRLRRHPRYRTKIERDHALGVVGRAGGDGPTLVLNGHVDVVPVERPERWTKPPWQGTIENGRMYGRGAVDMKGPLCSALFAYRAIHAAGVTLRGGVAIQSVIGEEDGGIGTLATIERGHRGDAAIVVEPTELAVAPAQAGALCFRVTVPGHSAHGALRDEGINPIDKFIKIYRALQDFELERSAAAHDPLFADYAVPYALSVGRLRSGAWDSSVPEVLTFEGRVGVAIDEEPADVRRAFAAVVDAAAQADDWLCDHGPVIEWWGGQYLPAATAVDHPIVTLASEAYRDVTGRAAAVRGMRYGSDMQLLVHEAGIPTILFGPGDIRQAHAPDEYVSIASLETAVRTIAMTILRYCGIRE